MAPRKRRRIQRRDTRTVAPESPLPWALPSDLLLEIAARSNPHAFIRLAAACKPLRHDLLSPSFLRRVVVNHPCILLACPRTGDVDDRRFTLVHPTTPAAASLCHDHLSPFFSRGAAGLFDNYRVETSRRGLLLLNRLCDPVSPPACPDLCVYDPMSGSRTFLSRPDVIVNSRSSIQSAGHKYILLTAADGIGHSFLLLVVHFSGWGVELQTASSCGEWGSATYLSHDHGFSWWSVKTHYRDPVVLHGGVIHWLMYHDKTIRSYDLRSGKVGSVELPSTSRDVDKIHLATSSDGKLLKLLAIEGFRMFVWLQLPISPAAGSGWSLETVIDMEEKLRSLHPNMPPTGRDKLIVFHGSRKRSGNVELLCCNGTVTVFDLETKGMHRQERASTLLEIDLPSRLHNMKLFS